MNVRYLLLETKVVLRNSRFLVFTIGLPAVLFLIYLGLFGDQSFADGTPAAAALMVSMSGYGAMGAALNTGMGIALERGYGWLRQLRLTPMSGWTYLITKAVLAMLVGIPAIGLVSGLGAVVGGVHLDARQWLTVTVGVWLAVLPFALLGVAIGQYATPDSAQTMGAALMMVLGLAGGMWFPPEIVPAWMLHVMQATPSYWLRAVGLSAVGGGDAATGVAVLGAWAVAAALVATRRYRADLARA
ncbi:ABC transporter permease [Hamadaea tsunoensis]|uniref:ABC transporter permease n=1 Tax=Hamadaea tsunoensis TaxID=53368 RepID=UPI00041B34CB|nr:ABC transporter permease [Hamadaea tsunoensis]